MEKELLNMKFVREDRINVELTQELLKSIFDYREDGYLIWKIKYSRKVLIGKVAGYRNPKKDNREMICLSGKMHLTYRLIFLYHHGYMPIQVDHKDRNPGNNRIENLRAATQSQNNHNTRSRINSSSKYLGVHYSNNKKRFVAVIKIDGKDTYLGSFKDENLAAIRWNEMAAIHYKEFANLNIIE